MTFETKALVDSGCACTMFHKVFANAVLNGDKGNCLKILSNDQNLTEIEPLNIPVQFLTIETKAREKLPPAPLLRFLYATCNTLIRKFECGCYCVGGVTLRT